MKYRIEIKVTDKYNDRIPKVGEYWTHNENYLYQKVDDSLVSKIHADISQANKFISLLIEEDSFDPPSYCWTPMSYKFYILEIIGFDDKTKEVIFGVKKDPISFPIQITERYKGVINKEGLKIECQTISHDKIKEIYELSQKVINS